MKKIVNDKKPYKKIKDLPVLISVYNDKMIQLLEKEAEPVKEQIESAKLEVQEELSKYDFKDEFTSKVTNNFNNLSSRVENASNFDTLAAIKGTIDSVRVKLITEILDRAKPPVVVTPPTTVTGKEPVPGPKPPVVNTPVTKRKSVSMKTLVNGIRLLKMKMILKMY